MNLQVLNHDGIAFITPSEQVSYQELQTRAQEFVSVVPARSVVLFVATNGAESLIAYVACIKHGIIPLMASSSISRESFDALLSAYRPEFIWCPKDFDYQGMVACKLGGYLLRATGLDNLEPPHPDLALMLSTSGSTGSQRYVRLSLANINANASSIAQYLNITAAEKAITTLPFSYSYGLSIINSHLISGATVLLTENTLFDRDFWDFLREAQASSFGGVPYTYSMLKRLRFNRMELPSLRYITQAGGRLGEELQQEFVQISMNKAIEFFVMYGQTEATARISYLPSQDSLAKLGSIGIAIPGGRMSLLDSSEQPIDLPNTAGELIYQGPNVSMGYAIGRADLAKGDELNGRLATGDLATFDDEGFYYIVGRMKRFLKIYGNRVNLDEVESALLKAGIIAACAGQDDAMRIFVEQGEPQGELSAKPQDEQNQIQAKASAITGLNKGAFAVQSIPALPRNDAGKILYAALEELC